MDHQQVQVVLSVARHLSFSEAAFETARAVSTVSKQVAALEEELGVRLFVRNGRSAVTLTDHGRALLPDLERLAADYDDLQAHIKLLMRENSSRLAVSYPNALSTMGEDELLADFCVQNPELTVEHDFNGGLDAIAARLLSGQTDVVFWMRAPTEPISEALQRSDIGVIELSRLGLKMLLGKDHPAISAGCVDLARLRDEVFVFRGPQERNMQAHPKVQCFIEACRSEGFTPKLRFANLRSSTAFSLAEAGLGVIPLMHAPHALPQGVVCLPTAKDYYRFSVEVYYKKTNRSAALHRFLQFLAERKQEAAKTE